MGGLFGVGSNGIGGSGTMGQIINGALGSLVDPANFSHLFGKNSGPGAFMDPNGTGGSFLPGQSFGSKGILGVNPQMGYVGYALPVRRKGIFST